MPAVSEAQRRYLAEKFGPDWMKAHGFDNAGPLPDHVAALAHAKPHKKKTGYKTMKEMKGMR